MGGLRTKLKDIRNNFLLLTPVPNIIVLTETWLTPANHDTELGFQNYTLYRQNRPLTYQVTRGRCVLIAIKDTFYPSVCSFPSQPEVVCIDQHAVAIHIGDVKILIGAVYIPPGEDSKDSDYSSHADAIDDLSSVYHDRELIIVGDYNIRGVTWKNPHNLDVEYFPAISQPIKAKVSPILDIF